MTAAVRFGQMLQEARQLRGLTPQQLATQTCIPLGHVEALEAGLLHAIPGGLYLRAEARAYADAVALDPQVVLRALKHALASDSAVTPSPIDTEVQSSPQLTADTLSVVPESTGWAKHRRVRWRLAAALVFGGAALLFGPAGRSPSIPSELSKMAAGDVPVDPEKVLDLDNVVGLAEAVSAPALSQTLFAPRTGAAGAGAPGGRLESGRLIVQSTPAGARVTVNGVGWGATPVAIRYLPFGTMRVRLVKDNYRARERLVELTPGTPTSTLRVTLPRIPGRSVGTASTGPTLVVNTTPPGARVTINGIGWGSTPVSIPHLPLGAQRLRVVKERFISEERVVQLGEGQSRSITIALRRAESR